MYYGIVFFLLGCARFFFFGFGSGLTFCFLTRREAGFDSGLTLKREETAWLKPRGVRDSFCFSLLLVRLLADCDRLPLSPMINPYLCNPSFSTNSRRKGFLSSSQFAPYVIFCFDYPWPPFVGAFIVVCSYENRNSRLSDLHRIRINHVLIGRNKDTILQAAIIDDCSVSKAVPLVAILFIVSDQ